MLDTPIQTVSDGDVACIFLCGRRFAAPEGILGEHYHNTLDFSQERQALNMGIWQQWQLPNNIILSTKSRSQMWAVQFSDTIQSNVMWLSDNSLPRHRFRTRIDDEAICFLFEGAIFGPSGIAQVRKHKCCYIIMMHVLSCVSVRIVPLAFGLDFCHRSSNHQRQR